MKKIELCIEELRVDSFGTGAQSGERGTVRAHDLIDDYEPFPTGDGNPYSVCQTEAESFAENTKSQAQRHQIRQETAN